MSVCIRERLYVRVYERESVCVCVCAFMTECVFMFM
jgi:hypothetical protein